MAKDEIKELWQYAELQQYLKKHMRDPDVYSKTVFLANPAEKAELDNIILKHLWPSVIRGLGSSGIWTKSLKKGFPRSAIEDEKYPYTARSLTFLLEDSRRQISAMGDVPSWHCRGKILCSVSDYMLSVDFYVYLPEDFSWRKLLRLLKNPEFAGLPPELSYEKLLSGKGIFSLAFKKGSGAGWGLRNHNEAASIIREEIQSNIEVIQAVYELERDYQNTEAFNELEKVLVRNFASG